VSLAARAGRLADALGFVVCALAIAWSADIATRLQLEIYSEQFAAFMLGLAFGIAFLRFPLRPGAPAWHDLALTLVGIAAGGWLAWRYPVLLNESFFRPGETFTLASLVIVLSIEGTRRSAGSSLLLVLALLAVYALFGNLLPGVLQARQIPIFRLVSYLGLDTAALLGSPLLIAGTVVVAFVFFGRVLQACGGADFFTELAQSVFGRYRGGAGKVEVVASGLFGMISGSAVSNVMTTGVVTIPMMKRAGYAKETAAGIEAIAATGGQLMPPVMGAAAFLMAEFLQIPYAEVALAATIPALLFYVAVFVQVDLEAARKNIIGYGLAEIPRTRDVLRKGWLFLIPFGVLFGILFGTNLPAEQAAICGAIALVPLGLTVGYGERRLTWRGLIAAIAATGRDTVDVILICAIAGLVIGILQITGLAFGMSIALLQVGGNNLFVLLVAVAVVCTILGMGMPTTAVYLLVATLAAPSLIKLGVSPIAAHMFVFVYGILSMITPPVALAAFAAGNIAQADPMRVGFTACMLGWPAFLLPFMFVYSPTLLLIGPPLQVTFDIVTAFAGVWMASCGISGYFRDELPPLIRLGYVVAGLFLLLPSSVFEGAMVANFAGLALMTALMVREYARRALVPKRPRRVVSP